MAQNLLKASSSRRDESLNAGSYSPGIAHCISIKVESHDCCQNRPTGRILKGFSSATKKKRQRNMAQKNFFTNNILMKWYFYLQLVSGFSPAILDVATGQPIIFRYSSLHLLFILGIILLAAIMPIYILGYSTVKLEITQYFVYLLNIITTGTITLQSYTKRKNNLKILSLFNDIDMLYMNEFNLSKEILMIRKYYFIVFTILYLFILLIEIAAIVLLSLARDNFGASNQVLSYFGCLYILPMCWMKLRLLQNTFYVCQLKQFLQLLNRKLEGIVDLKRGGGGPLDRGMAWSDSKRVDNRMLCNQLKCMSRIYDQCWQLHYHFNIYFGFSNLILLASLICTILIHVFIFRTMDHIRITLNWYFILVVTMPFVLVFIHVHFNQYCMFESQLTGVFLHRLTGYIDIEDVFLCSSIKLFSLQIQHDAINLSVLTLFQLDYKTYGIVLVSVFSTLTSVFFLDEDSEDIIGDFLYGTTADNSTT